MAPKLGPERKPSPPASNTVLDTALITAPDKRDPAHVRRKADAWPVGRPRLACLKSQLAITRLRHGLTKTRIRTIPDYPKPGIMFRDITTLLGNPRAFRRAVDELVQPYAGMKIDKVAGIEARGFILGGAVAHQLSVGFVPVRKKGKLPHTVIGEDYDLEYGTDRVEIHTDALRKGRAACCWSTI